MNKNTTEVKVKNLLLAKKMPEMDNLDVSNKTPVDKQKKPLSKTSKNVIRPLAGRHRKHQDKCAIEKKMELPHAPKSPTKKVKKTDSAKDPKFEVVAPFVPGLHIAGILDQSLSLHAHSTITQLMLGKSEKIGIPFPDVDDVLSLYTVNARQFEQAKFFDLNSFPIKTKVKQEYKVCGSSPDFDWLREEGISILLPIISAAKGWVVLEQKIIGPITPSRAECLFRIRAAAKQAGVYVMLILICHKDDKKSELINSCDDYIEIALCEQDIGSQATFSIDCVGISLLNDFCSGKTMCSVRLSNRVFRRRYTSFISNSLESRLMWILRGHDKTFEEIGKILKRNKTTVMRRLDKLPKPVRMVMPKGLLESYLESFAFASRAADDDDVAKSEA